MLATLTTVALPKQYAAHLANQESMHIFPLDTKNQFTWKQPNRTIGDGPWAIKKLGSSDNMTGREPQMWTPTECFTGLHLLRKLERRHHSSY
jgi:hypothetical protein